MCAAAQLGWQLASQHKRHTAPVRASIDCRYIREVPSGIGAYVRALIDRLPLLAPSAMPGSGLRPALRGFLQELRPLAAPGCGDAVAN